MTASGGRRCRQLAIRLIRRACLQRVLLLPQLGYATLQCLHEALQYVEVRNLGTIRSPTRVRDAGAARLLG